MEREVRLWGCLSHMLAEAQHAPRCSSPVNENSEGFFVELSGGLKAVFRADSPGFPGGPLARNPPGHTADASPSLVLEEPTRHGAAKPLGHNC